MGVIENSDIYNTFSARRKLGIPNGLGNTLCGLSEYGYRSLIDGVYYPRTIKGEQKIVRRLYVIPRDPQTLSQLNRRVIFASAMQGWHDLTSDERKIYNERAKKFRGKYGVHLWLREYLKTHF